MILKSLNKDSILEQLVEFYYKHDKFQTVYLNIPEAKALYTALFEQNRLCLCMNGEKLLGCGEHFRIGYEEWGRIICGESIYKNLSTWQIKYGPIAYVGNVTIHPDHRNSFVMKELTRQFFVANKDAKYFVGRAFRKRHQPIKVFDFHESYLKWTKDSLKEELHHGR